ncbi:uncharacterized protein LOC124635733 isoform X2 [Helicoverpa zea]|uniref:uncharacterized protein LOC124635733 isoform X2 n=1 Tax=Helicoverpa zea TaxID=7113 RepID=UPI001F57E2A3|nr:uncharacterized protein LOC124635733 isoform X2 [Helicoverpa zea]
MFLLPLLCLTLSFYASANYLSYSCRRDPYYGTPPIFLVREPDKSNQTWNINKDMNHAFIEACKNFYVIRNVSIQDSFDNNIVFFGFSGDDDEFNRITQRGLEVVGDAVETLGNVTCEQMNNYEICNRTKVVNLVSKQLRDNYGDDNVYDLIQNMIGDKETRTVTHGRSCAPVFQNITELYKVVLCDERYTDINVYIHPLKVVVSQMNDCKSTLKKYDYSVLALLTSKGFDHSSVHSVPTIFYDTLYASEEDEAAFPNSVTLLPWRLLKYGFLGFIRSMGWERVVIVSDVSQYSIEFEHELTTLFVKERIVYTTVKSEDYKFDVAKISKKLHMTMPRIVIANLEEENALKLMRLWPGKITVWIARDISKQRADQQLPQRLFSISLGAVTEPNCGVVANILSGLTTILRAYHAYIPTALNPTMRRRNCSKLLTEEARKLVQETAAAKAYVYKLARRPAYDKLISTLRVDYNGFKVLHVTNPFKTGIPSDGTAQCLAKSNTYSKRCEDTFVLLLMCVVILFFTTALLISCYFHKSSPYNDPRYHNF